MNPAPSGPRQTRKLAYLVGGLVGVWALVAVMNSLQWWTGALATGGAQPWVFFFKYAAIGCAVWAVLTPAAVLAASRYRLRRRRWTSFGLLHLLLGCGFALVHTGLYVSVITAIERPDPGLLLLQKLSGNFQLNLLIYLIIMALTHVVEFYQALQTRAVAEAQLEARLAQAETAALKAQLQPHFLFNALNTVSAMIEREPVQARALVARLGDLLRVSIDGHREQESCLQDELDFTEAYLAIEQARLGARLRIARDIDPAALSARLPSMLIQPLVENAILHGIAPRVSGGCLTLRAKLEGGRLSLEVSDNGRGAAQIVERIGLGNARRRLVALYGDRQAFDVATAPDAGFRVRISVPQ